MGNTYLNVGFVTETCCAKGCNITFAFTRDYYDRVRNDPSIWWFCPAGHTQHYTGKNSDAERLRQAAARETALSDQLEAAVREAESTRGQLLRDRQRFANGVCPCCNRSFTNVLRHMESKHPDYRAEVAVAPEFKCSCGRKFRTLGGLHQHQTKGRGPDWWKPKTAAWLAHLTRV